MEKEILRGLDIRVALAIARVSESIYGQDKTPLAVVDVFLEARSMGYQDYKAGLPDVPQMFRAEPVLTAGWKEGFSVACELDLIAQCPSCQSGNPCSMHS